MTSRNRSSTQPQRIVIVGAGLAGAATAFHLRQEGGLQVTLLDREIQAGCHSSARNAAMIRQFVSPIGIAAMAQESAEFYRRDADLAAEVTFDQTGSYLVGNHEEVQALWGSLLDAGLVPEGSELLSAGELAKRNRDFEGGAFEAAIWCPSDGVIDVAALLDYYLAEALNSGTEFRSTTLAQRLVYEDGELQGLETSRGFIPADIVVNATGPWAGHFNAEALDAGTRGIRPLRRHLFFTGALKDGPRGTPFLWDISNHWYRRNETGGLLLSACDESEVEPGIPHDDPDIAGLLQTKLESFAPDLADVPLAKTWAGIRTFTSDRSFLIGDDPEFQGLVWVACLGGHGVTCSFAVGAAAARWIRGCPEERDLEFAPSRLPEFAVTGKK